MKSQQLLMVWASIACSPVMLAGVGLFVFSPTSSVSEAILLALGAVALAIGAAAMTVPVMLIKQLEPHVVLLMRWAMLEGIAALGLVARVLGANTETFLAFIVSSVFLLVLSRPRAELLEDLAKLKRS